MIELFVLGLVTLAVVTVVSVVVAGLSFVLWVVFLPFRILGWLFKGLLLAPVLLLLGGIGILVFGLSALAFLLPLAPFLLLGFLIWRLMRGRSAPASA